MKVSVEEVNSVERVMTVEIPAKEVGKVMGKIYKKLARQAKIKGFRPGKAPRSILERYYGPQVGAEAAENIIGENYGKALEEAKLEPLAQPDFDFDIPDDKTDFIFKVTLDVKPEFDLDSGAYKGLKLKEPALEVTTEEVNQRIDQLRERQAVLMSIDEPRPAESGDVVIVDYESFVDDKPLEGGASENMEVELGKGNTVPEIELALLRTSPGDAAEAEVEFEDDAPRPDLAGKKVKYALKVKDIKQKVLPTLDDDFARSLGPDFDSLEMLINKIKEELGSYNEQQKETALRTQILDQLRDLSDFDIPKTLVSAEAREMVESFKQRMRQSGMDPEQTGLDEEKLLEGFRDQAEKKVKSGIVLGKISDMENVEVGDEDLDAELEKISGRVGQPPDAIKQIYNKNNMMPSLAAQVMEEKTLQAIKAAAIIESVDPAELAKETQKNEAEESSNNQVDA